MESQIEKPRLIGQPLQRRFVRSDSGTETLNTLLLLSPDKSACACIWIHTEIAQPFIVTVLPTLTTSLLSLPTTSSATASSGSNNGHPSTSLSPQHPTISIRACSTLTQLSDFSLPIPQTTPPHPYTIQHLASSQSSSQTAPKPPLFCVSTPTERAVAANEGSTVWVLKMKSLGAIVDELMQSGEYEEALELLAGIDERTLPDKLTRIRLLRSLRALTVLPSAPATAIETFLDLDITPAKVIALFPEVVSGRLAMPDGEAQIQTFGGPKVRSTRPDESGGDGDDDASVTSGLEGAGRKVLSGTLAALGLGTKHDDTGTGSDSTPKDQESRPASLKGSIRGGKEIDKLEREKERDAAGV